LAERANAILSDTEIEHFYKAGLIIPQGFRLPGFDVARLSAAVDKAVCDNPDTPTDHLYNLHLDGALPFGNHVNSAFTDLIRNPDFFSVSEIFIHVTEGGVRSRLVKVSASMYQPEADHGQSETYNRVSR